MVGMVAVAYATLGQRWLQVGKPTVVFSTSAHRQIQTSILHVFATVGQRWLSFCQRQLTVSYRSPSSVHLPTLGKRWLNVRQPTVIFSTSAHRQLQTSILRVFADIGPTLAQGEKANCHFVNISPSSATDVYPPCMCRHWANVGSK